MTGDEINIPTTYETGYTHQICLKLFTANIILFGYMVGNISQLHFM